MEPPSDLRLRCNLLESALEIVAKKRNGFMFVKWLENVMTTISRDFDRFEEYLDQFGILLLLTSSARK